mgnify:CR=1 FL=1
MINFTGGEVIMLILKIEDKKEEVYHILLLSLQIRRSDFQHFTISIVNFREQILKSIVWGNSTGKAGTQNAEISIQG